MNILVKRDDVVNLSGEIQRKLGGIPNPDDPLTIKEMANAVKYISGDSGSSSKPKVVKEKTINFYDYDGTLIYSYTHEEASILQKLPEAPDHTDIGLTFQEWNETDLSFLHLVNTPTDIAAIYKPTDGKCHIGLRVLDTNVSEDDAYYMGTYCVGGTLHVNWGDGTEDTTDCSGVNHRSESYYGGGYNDNAEYSWTEGGYDPCKFNRIHARHKYAEPGDYEVTIWGENCTDLMVDTYYMGYQSSSDLGRLITKIWYSDQVKSLGVRNGPQDPFMTEGLESIVMPNSITKFNNGAFNSYSGYNTKTLFVGIPKSLTYFSEYVGASTTSPYPWVKISFPRTVTDICYALYVYAFGNSTAIRMPSLYTGGPSFSSYSSYMDNKKIYFIAKGFKDSNPRIGYGGSSRRTKIYVADDLYDDVNKGNDDNFYKASCENGIIKKGTVKIEPQTRDLAFTSEVSGSDTLYSIPVIKNSDEIITEVSQ